MCNYDYLREEILLFQPDGGHSSAFYPLLNFPVAPFLFKGQQGAKEQGGKGARGSDVVFLVTYVPGCTQISHSSHRVIQGGIKKPLSFLKGSF